MALKIRHTFDQFFPQNPTAKHPGSDEWLHLSNEQKKELALYYLKEGELALSQGNLTALSMFEAACELDPNNPKIWHRQGVAFFEYGSLPGKENALKVAGKNFKMATKLDPGFFEAWVDWGNTLLQSGRFHEEHHFFLEAKDKYQKALDQSFFQPSEILAELYWDYGMSWFEIGSHSGEAHDIRLAIDALQESIKLQTTPPAELLHDCGKIYLEMGLLVNERHHFAHAIQSLQTAVETDPKYCEAWLTLAETYSQLYMNTMDERLIAKASYAYQQATRLDPKNGEAWLSWAEILAESGKLNRDPKLLRQSVEKCARANSCDRDNPQIKAQWVESLSMLGALTNRLDLVIEAEHKMLDATEAHPDDPDLCHAYGVCLASFGRYYDDPDYYEFAIDKIQDALSADRTTAEHWQTLGSIHKSYAELTHHADLLQRANRFFAIAMDIKPCCPSILFDAARSLFHTAQIENDLASLQKAVVHFETLISSHRDALFCHPEWLFEYASALQWLFDFSSEEVHLFRAMEIFSHVLLIDPDFPAIHYQMACCYVELGRHTFDLENYKKAISFFRLSTRQEPENDQIWLDWGICLIHLANQTHDAPLSSQLYWDAEQKINRAGQLGNPAAFYHLACLNSIVGRLEEAMVLIHKSLNARALPPIDEMVNDEWLDNLRSTEQFARFLEALEARLQQTREQ